MSSRNITKVIYGGKVVLSQGGMIDERPTEAGRSLRNSLQNLKVARIKQLFDNVQYEEKMYTIPMDTKKLEIFSEIGFIAKPSCLRKQKTICNIIKTCIDNYGWDITEEYFMAFDSLGYHVLDIMDALRKLEPKKPIHIYLENESRFTEGVYALNLDEELFEARYKNVYYNWTFDRLPNDSKLANMEEMAEELSYECDSVLFQPQ